MYLNPPGSEDPFASDAPAPLYKITVSINFDPMLPISVSLAQKRRIVTFGDASARLDNVLESMGACHISHPPNHDVQLASFVPPPSLESPPLPLATLTVFPDGHQYLDHIVLSALVVCDERGCRASVCPSETAQPVLSPASSGASYRAVSLARTTHKTTMAKRKSPTPQELYQARKEREEQERTALLPPGLINHGNTCFMNSVLQGLIATRLLSDLAQFTPISPAVQRHSRIRLLSQRSPELTNAHSQAGEYEREWVDMMPIGDVFIDTMYKAWDNQKNLKRENMSPKSLLHAVGKKYDQYLDFAQQDAHEFLRILLDAMRMEEFDVIKARQPPPANTHKKRKRRRTELGVTPTTPQEEDDSKLVSFTDMIFAGRLTSVLVCQKCKHVSQTYEDFNDLSLSIKPDDAGKGHKRSRFKSFAKRLTAGTSNWNVASRSASTPPAPRERAATIDGPEDGDPPPTSQDDRRRSLDLVTDPGSSDENTEGDAKKDAAKADDKEKPTSEKDKHASEKDKHPSDKHTSEKDKHCATSAASVEGEKRASVDGDHRVEFSGSKDGDGDERKCKDKSADGWVKLGRRISVSMGLARSSKEKERRSRSRQSRELVSSSSIPEGQLPPANNSNNSNSSSDSLTSAGASDAPAPLNVFRARVTSWSSSRPGSAAGSPRRPSFTPASPSVPSTMPPSVHPTPSVSPSRTGTPSLNHHTRHKSPKPPELPPAEAEFLRRVLPGEHGGLLGHHHPGPGASTAQRPSMWAKLGHFPNVEECLRAFTAVEVLDGENMVGCRRCWKIANGVYKQQKTGEEPQEGEDADDTDSAEGASPTAPDDAMRDLADTLRSQSSPVFTPLDEDGSMTSISSRAAASAPDSAVDISEIEEQPLSRDKPLPSVPTISMTAAEGDEGAKRALADGAYPCSPPPESRDSLTIPRRQQRPRSDADGASGDESDGSAQSSMYSGDTDDSIQPHPSNAAAKKKKPKPTVLRPAYKRYLIAAPPPVLVIHLKRFQQISKTSFVSFSSGFKKLEDYVAFPEWLDLKPYLAPTKEECAMGKKASAEHARKSEPCMYRLYAVVVHIGSMLGGHYIAYTALPPREDEPMHETEDGKKVPPKRQWAYISDTFVRLTTIEEVLKAKAYICMYERV
ncbi:hypothetical protein GGG16DRAFT_127836 [Schizophyllum commune]